MSLHPLALWDAPFLPGKEVGSPLAKATSLPLRQRRQLAAQLVAAVSFFLDQGFYPHRGLWRSAGFVLEKGIACLRLREFPRWPLAEPALATRLAKNRRGEALAWHCLKPFLCQLLPEERGFWQQTPDPEEPWDWPRCALHRLLSKDRQGKVLQHPQGLGRFLWARHFAWPKEGSAFYCREEALVFRLSQLPGVKVGAFTPESLGRLQGESLPRGEALFLSTSLLPGLKPLPLDSRLPLWCLLPRGQQGKTAEFLAGLAFEDPQGLLLALSRAVASAWQVGVSRENPWEDLLSYPATQLLQLLRSSGMGIKKEEANQLVQAGSQGLEELQRFSLVLRRFGRFWAAGAQESTASGRKELALRLPPGPLRWACQAEEGDSRAKLAAWCEACLEEEAWEEVLGLAPAAEGIPELKAAVCEAALATGWLSVAYGLWHGLPPPLDLLFQGWWATEAGEQAKLGQLLEAFAAMEERTLPRRLQGRKWLLQAAWAQGQGRPQVARLFAEKTLGLAEGSPALQVEACFYLGPQALEKLTKDSLPQLLQQRAFHLLGILAFRQGQYAQAKAWLDCALSQASGANPLRLGELLADAGSTALLLDRLLEAERLYAAAEFWLDLAGSRRALSLLRFNQAVLANDRLRPQRAQELLRSLSAEAPEEDAFWAVEWARSCLARGDLQGVKPWEEKLRQLASSQESAEHLQQGAATVLAHAALLSGNLEEAKGWASQAEPSEKELFQALFCAPEGEMPKAGLPTRWGMAFSARLLASARASAAALERAFQGGRENPEEKAVGLARAVLLAPLWRLSLAAPLRPYWPQARAVLREQGLEPWVALVGQRFGRDLGEVVRAMELVLREKRDSFQRPNWEPLFQALGLSFLQVALGGKVLVRLGPGPALWQGEVAGFQVELAPAPEEEILALLSLVCSQASLAQERLAEDHQALGLSGTSPALEALRQEIRRFGPLPITVLICGEPGTGKERVARALHQVSGRTGPFVAVNCAGVPEGLLEAELFGVVRGAFTGADRDRPGLVEQAEGGTLFLDEIGELPLAMQAKLLRLLQEKEVRRLGDLRARKVDVRFVAATNRDLRQAVQAGSFRQDLYDRLATVVLRVPPLRQRPEDIPLLVRELVSGFSRQLGLPSVTIAGEVMAHLAQQSWPGNVRQLEAVLIQALARCRPGETLSLRHLTAEGEEAVPPLLPWEEAKRRFARQYFGRLLAACNGNRSEAAKRAGLSRQALHYHLDQLGLPQEEPS